MKRKFKTLRLILGDQLNAQHSWFRKRNDDVIYVIAELHQESNYVKHHVQKLCAFFAAMENFAEALQKNGHHVRHMTLDDTASFADLPALIQHLCQHHNVSTFAYQRPDEYRLEAQLGELQLDASVKTEIYDTEHFLVPYEELPDYFSKQQHTKMEFFYRKMRQRFDILMEANRPLGDKWNYDSENRQKIKPDDLDHIPEPLVFAQNVKAILKRLDKHKIDYFGARHEKLLWPTSRRESLRLLDHFCRTCLPRFGRFQDAMTANSPHQWSLYHSRLSFAINSKMLHPMQVVEKAIAHYEQSDGEVTLAQIEGFVRQIIGWREYVRGVYWLNMPEYANTNALKAKRKLPEFFWTGETDMSCLRHAISQSLEYAYAHHIQRLMITGNFCLVSGINPDEVDAWYLGIYIDAIEWVEMPNTRGMSQFADGGIVATKPYAAGGNYTNKMSDYCKDCRYNIKEKTGEDACPINSLYWDFMIRHRERFSNNPRIGMIYRNWDKQSEGKQKATLSRAKWCLNNLDSL